MDRRRQSIPGAVLRRLARYLTHVEECRAAGAEWVSSKELAESLGLTPSTVRQDMSHVDFCGVAKRGYATAGLERVLSSLLGADTVWRMVVVGAGNLGRALALHEEFRRRGFQIEGVFDNDPAKVGRGVGRLTVRSTHRLPEFVGRRRVDIGVIAVPAPAAQSVADLLIASGVRGMLNLANAHVIAPRRVAVVDARVILSLLEVTHAIKSLAASGRR